MSKRKSNSVRKADEVVPDSDYNPLEEEKLEDETLPVKNSFRVSETASYFDVAEATIRNWIAHGHLQAERVGGGTIMITRRSILRCRFGKRVIPRVIY